MNETCTKFEEKILTGEISGDVRAHIAQCPDCAAFEHSVNTLRLPKEMDVPAFLDDAVKAAAREAAEERSLSAPRFRRRMLWFSSAAACILTAAAFGLLLPETKTPETAVTASVRESTASEDIVYTAELDKELLSLSMDIERTENLYASVSSAPSYFAQSVR